MLICSRLFLFIPTLSCAACVCTQTMGAVTTPMVVKSAMIHGGHARKSMEELHALMSTRALHVPSPLRLLRISNGKVCEFCLQDKVNHLRPGTAVFACWSCLTSKHDARRYAAHWATEDADYREGACSLTRPWNKGWARYRHNAAKYDAIFSHGRVAANMYGVKAYMWSHHRTDLSGERVGPIVAWGDVDRIERHFQSAEEMTSEAIDNYLASHLNAPSVERYDEFNTTFTAMVQRAERAAEERVERAAAKKDQTKITKAAKAEKICVDLTPLIDESFRGFAMKRAVNPWFQSKGAKLSTVPSICLETSFIDALLKPYVITPSKMKKKVLVELAETINGKLRMIDQKGILAFEFLTDEDPFEKALKAYLRDKLPSVQALFDVRKIRVRRATTAGGSDCYTNHVSPEFISLVESDKLFEAVAYMIGDISPVLLTVEPSKSAAAGATKYDESALSKLAEYSWTSSLHKLKCDERSRLCMGDNKREGEQEEEGGKKSEAKSLKLLYKEAFDESQDAFVDILSGLDEYFTWLSQNHPADTEIRFKRQVTNALERGHNVFWTSHPLEQIRKRDFGAMNQTGHFF